MTASKIVIKGARVNNLKNISLELPHQKLIVITGLSGSGKSSLAFDTIYAEGQRRYVESLSSYARQFLEQMEKPDVDQIEGLSPAIAIDQKTGSNNPRSTVGTATEIYDLFRLLFAKIGIPHCPKCGKKLQKQNIDEVKNHIVNMNPGNLFFISAPVISDQKGDHKNLFLEIIKAGYYGALIDGERYAGLDLKNLVLDRREKHSIEIIVSKGAAGKSEDFKTRLTEVLKTTFDLGNGIIKLLDEKNELVTTWSLYYQCIECRVMVGDVEPRMFSFNSPHGACPSCTGLGTKQEVDPDLVITNPKLTIAEGAIKPWSRLAGGGQNGHMKLLEQVAEKYAFSLHVPVKELPEAIKNLILYGTHDEIFDREGKILHFEGVIPNLERKYGDTDSEYLQQEIEAYMRVKICPNCKGARLKKESLAVKIAEYSIADLTDMDIVSLAKTLEGLASKLNATEKRIADQVIKESLKRLGYIQDIGLSYLTLGRGFTSLSGGEAQRIRLATQIGSRLTGVIYILDEPSIGLHPKNVDHLINTLQNLKKLGNTVIVVEHDESIMETADWIVDVGPGAGAFGGIIIAEGTPKEIKNNPKSITGKYLSGKLCIPIPEKTRNGNKKSLTVVDAEEHNLKKITVSIPLGTFTCITGVSGSGKSSLINDILSKSLSAFFYKSKELPGKHREIRGMENLDKVITIDQSAIGKTPRSNPATYTGVFTYIRDLYTQIPEAKIRGYDAGKFSFNVKGGRCEACAGEGFVQIEMKFLPDVFVPCEVCHGRRYSKEALEIFYHGKNIADVLEMSVAEAKIFFKETPIIADKLTILDEVGLGYIKLGQSATTLSGGEAQRVKLATELSRRSTGKTLYILDEPTTGLHFADTQKLLAVLNRLVDKGNTVLVIEHNLDVIKSSDWVIDLGPEGGDKGGYLVAEGTPKKIAQNKKSLTGQCLKAIFEKQ